MTDAPAIRTASTADLAAVRDLLLRTWRMTYIPRHGARKVEAIIRRWHNDERLLADIGDESAVFLLAEIDGRVVGHAFAQTAGATVVRLQRLYVDPDRHRQGIGTTLLEEIIDRLDQTDAHYALP